MICIADSGSTKTDWLLVDIETGTRLPFKSIGLNPFFVNETMVEQTLQDALPEEQVLKVNTVYFYGAGCSSEDRNAVLYKGLSRIFVNATLHVYHDLLGAARACCQHSNGIVSILGTGSNSCKYNGQEIADNVSNLGFILGDEGSGGHIGKELIRARSYREMPPDIEKDFDETYGYSHEHMLRSVYNLPMPNRYVASFAPFSARHRQSPFIQALLAKVFTEFTERHLVKYGANDWPHHFLGSIACEYEPELKKVLDTHGLRLGKVLKKPIEALAEFHRSQHVV